jgi:hypothetical protein
MLTLQEQLKQALADLWAVEAASGKADVALIDAEVGRRKSSENLTKACRAENQALENVVQACLELEKRRSETQAVMPDFIQTGKDVGKAVTVVNDFREKLRKAHDKVKRLKEEIKKSCS